MDLGPLKKEDWLFGTDKNGSESAIDFGCGYRDSGIVHSSDHCPECKKKIEKTTAVIRKEYTTDKWFDLSVCLAYKLSWWELSILGKDCLSNSIDKVPICMKRTSMGTMKTYSVNTLYFEPQSKSWIGKVTASGYAAIYLKILPIEALSWFEQAAWSPPKFLLDSVNAGRL